MALVEPPLRHGECGARGLHRRRLRFDLTLAPHRRAQLFERCLQRPHFGFARTKVCAFLVHKLCGRRAGLQQGLVARQIALRFVARRFGVGEIGFSLPNFGRLAAGLEVGELIFGLRQLARDLFARRPIVGVVLIEQRRAFGDLIATRDMDLSDKTLLRRADLHEIGLRVTLPFHDGGGMRAQIEPTPSQGGDGKRDKEDKAPIHELDLLQRNDIVALSF